MNLFQLGDFVLSSGKRSRWKLECDALADEDIRTLAEMIRQMVGPFSSVEGVPRGGLRLAAALQPLSSPSMERHLIVDDVLTTGSSIDRVADQWLVRWRSGKEPIYKQIRGAVLFARGQCPSWVKALFQMPELFWVKPRVRG